MLIISYIVQFKVQEVDTACLSIDAIYITVLVFAGINTLWYLFLFRVDYASDQEWHKYLVFMCIDILAQLLDVVLTLYFTAV